MQAQPEAAPPDPVRAVRVAGAERRADVDLGGHRQRVEQQRQQVPDPHRDLLAAECDRTEPGRDRGRGQRDDAERDRPHRQLVPVPEQGGDLGAAGPAGPHGRAPGGGAVPRGRRGLGDDRAPGRAEQAQVQAVDQQDLERDVQHVGADRDAQRRARVGQPDQVAVPGEGQVQERNPHGGRPQVADRAGQHVLAGAEQFRRPRAPPPPRPRRPRSRRPPPPGRPRRPSGPRGRRPGPRPGRPPPRSSRWTGRWPARRSWSARWTRWPARRAASAPGARRWRCRPGCRRARRRSPRARAARAPRCAGPVPGRAGYAARPAFRRTIRVALGDYPAPPAVRRGRRQARSAACPG